MLSEYGYGEIIIGQQVFEIAPTLKNMAKIGDSKAIMEHIESLQSQTNHSFLLLDALHVINCCSDKPICVDFIESKRTNGIKPKGIDQDEIPRLAVVALNCLKHGVLGEPTELSQAEMVENDSEIDPYKAIDHAVAYMGFSREEAANMTMTEFVRQCELRDPERENKKIEAQVKSSYLDYLANRKD